MTGEGTLLLVIAIGVMSLVGWLAWRGSEATEDEARAYADRTLQRLLFNHDAKYFAANLSPAARPRYPAGQQRYIITSLTSLGLPSAPVHLNGAVTYGTDPGVHDPTGHFEAQVVYPAARSHVYLDVARRQGLWRIDYFGAEWKNNSAPAPVPYELR